jgi:hypothetical protein
MASWPARGHGEATDGGAGGVYVAARAALEQLDGGVLHFGPLPDGGVVLVALEPWKAMQLADERQLRDAQLAAARAAPPPSPPAAWLGVVAGFLNTALQTVPIIIEVARRQP